MKKNGRLILVFCALTFFTKPLLGNELKKQQKVMNVMNNELLHFIDSVKSDLGELYKYSVFVAYIFPSNLDKQKGMCFTLGYILNGFEVKNVSPDFVYYYGGEIVVIRIAEEIKGKFNKTLHKISLEDSLKIVQKLYPTSKKGISAITYEARALVSCEEGNKVRKVFYDNSNVVPREKSIYKNFPTGGVIRKIETRNK